MALFILFLTVILVACGNKITEGEVYEKEFIPAHTETMLVPIVIFNGKTTTTTLIPETKNVPDEWYIKIQSVEADENGKYEKAEYSVTEEIFNSYEVGDLYSHEGKDN